MKDTRVIIIVDTVIGSEMLRGKMMKPLRKKIFEINSLMVSFGMREKRTVKGYDVVNDSSTKQIIWYDGWWRFINKDSMETFNDLFEKYYEYLPQGNYSKCYDFFDRLLTELDFIKQLYGHIQNYYFCFWLKQRNHIFVSPNKIVFCTKEVAKYFGDKIPFRIWHGRSIPKIFKHITKEQLLIFLERKGHINRINIRI